MTRDEYYNDYYLKTSEIIKLKEKDIYTFSHNYLVNNWYDILKEQLIKIKNHGLYDKCTKMFFFAYGEDEQWNEFNIILNEFDSKNKIEIKRFNHNFYLL